MTSPFQPGQAAGATPGAPMRGALPTPPKGWPIGSYSTYAEAQRAVDYLSDQQFPVQQVTLVGVDSVYAPMALRAEAWRRLAAELPRGMLEANTRELGLSEIAAAATPMLEGRIRGRIVVDVNR